MRNPFLSSAVFSIASLSSVFPVLPVLLFGLFGLTAASSARADFTEPVTLSFRSDQISYQGPIDSAWLMLDVEGGRNRVSGAQRMTCQGQSPKTCSITLDLAEGNYIYVFVANPDAFVNMSDPALNPDDIPDSNFFRDPNPRNPGFCGQFSTDNCLFVRNPKRPTIDPTSFVPGHGALVTSDNAVIEARVVKGNDGRDINPQSVKVFFEDKEPIDLRYNPNLNVPAPSLVQVAGATFTASGNGGTIRATLNNPPEGFHRIFLSVSNTDGLESDPLEASVIVNRNNTPPVAHAGPTLFTKVNQEVQLDASFSEDNDHLGFTEYQWRVVSGPAGANHYFRCVDEELIPRDGFGKPILDEHGNPRGDACRRNDPGAMPRFAATVAGKYVIGLRVRDFGANNGTLSEESTTEVYVVPNWNTSIRPRIEVAVDNNTITLDGSLTENSSGNGFFVADALNPSSISLQTNGLRASFNKPATAGTYFFHFNVDNSYPATAMVRVKADGSVDGMDLARPPKKWQNDQVIYLGFVREFYDSDNDGEGDLNGMIDQVSYLSDLGVTTIWLMPLTPGPTTHGYAATGYFGIEEDYGTAEDLELLVETAKAFGIDIMMDLVANHTSDQHPFFKAARQNPQSPLRDWYAFNPDGSYRYAFTFFALPDNNQNSPIVRQNLIEVVDWFMDRGISALRCDIAGFTPASFWRLLRRHVKARDPEAVMLAELIPPMAEYFDDGFDLAYDSTTFWSTRDAFAQGGSFDAVDGALEDATRMIENAQAERTRMSVRQEDVLFMRYIDNQDEDRFLLRAGGDLRKAKAVASFLMTVPGVPLITYGNEVGIKELRGRMPFALYNEDTGAFSQSSIEELHRHYRKLINVRRGNFALRAADTNREFQNGNSYLRISSGFDEGGGNVYSEMRYAASQRFIVMSNRSDSTALGTTVRVFPPAQLFTDFPDGTLVLVDHLDPAIRINTTRAALTASGGTTFNVPGFGSRILQVTRFGIPDADNDKVLDSYDNCVGVSNLNQLDSDSDGVGDRCDACAGSLVGSTVGLDGCALGNAAGADPRREYRLDGKLDSAGYVRSTGSGSGAINLWASFNGQKLYVATEAAPRGQDAFILVTDDTGRTAVAPFGKAGTVPTGGIFLADEGENDFNKWFGSTGESVAFTEPLPGRGVLEGTINLVEEFGRIPEKIYISAVRYSGDDNGAIVAQAPAGDGNGSVDADEMIEFSLDLSSNPIVVVDGGVEEPVDSGVVSPDAGAGSDAGNGGGVVVRPGDDDGDNVENLQDNCALVFNPSQADVDNDGFGDACDACPLSSQGARVDERGCAPRVSVGEDDENNRPTPISPDDGSLGNAGRNEYGCNSTNTSTTSLWSLLLGGLFFFTRQQRQQRRQNSSVAVGVMGAASMMGVMSAMSVTGVLGAGCQNFGENGTREGFRTIQGTLILPDDGILGRQVTGLQIAAVTVENNANNNGQKTPVFFTSNVFNPASRNESSVFAVEIPTAAAVNLVLQVPSASLNGPGDYLGVLRFDDGQQLTTLLPAGGGNIQLGSVRADEGNPNTASDNVLSIDVSGNPLGQMDSNQDGTSDLLDDDDDGDGTADTVDADVAGDGVDDVAQILQALPDIDVNGIPDVWRGQ